MSSPQSLLLKVTKANPWAMAGLVEAISSAVRGPNGPRLRAGVALDLERLVVGPADPHARRQAHQRGEVQEHSCRARDGPAEVQPWMRCADQRTWAICVERDHEQRNDREEPAKEYDFTERDRARQLDCGIHQGEGKRRCKFQRDAEGRVSHGVYNQPRRLNQT